MSNTDAFPCINTETVISILNKTIDELQKAENVQKIEETRSTIGNEMLKMMQFLFPIIMQVQMDVLKEYGFPEGREGIIKFAQILRALEREDAEVARLHTLIKAYYLPPVSVHASNESSAEERINSS